MTLNQVTLGIGPTGSAGTPIQAQASAQASGQRSHRRRHFRDIGQGALQAHELQWRPEELLTALPVQKVIVVFADPHLRGPLALKLAPNGNFLTANGDATLACV